MRNSMQLPKSLLAKFRRWGARGAKVRNARHRGKLRAIALKGWRTRRKNGR